MADVTPIKSRTTVVKEVEGYGCGAVVALLSGGPAATVRCAVRSEGAPMVKVDWFLDGGELASADFFVAQLYRIEQLDSDVIVTLENSDETAH